MGRMLVFRLLSVVAMLTGAFVVGEIAPPIVQAVAQTTDPSTEELITGAGPDTGQGGDQGQGGGQSGHSTADHDKSRVDRHY